MNAMCQPQVSAIHGTIIGAMIGPKFEPELNKLVAKLRSFLGNQSATVLTDDGKLPASLIPKQMRAAKNPLTVDTSACAMAARLQPVIEMAYPILVPNRSTKYPKNNSPQTTQRYRPLVVMEDAGLAVRSCSISSSL